MAHDDQGYEPNYFVYVSAYNLGQIESSMGAHMKLLIII